VSSFVGECVFAAASNVCAGRVVLLGHKNGPGGAPTPLVRGLTTHLGMEGGGSHEHT